MRACSFCVGGGGGANRRDGTEVKPYVAPTREDQIKALKEEVFDVLVIGGGCVGSGGESSRPTKSRQTRGPPNRECGVTASSLTPIEIRGVLTTWSNVTVDGNLPGTLLYTTTSRGSVYSSGHRRGAAAYGPGPLFIFFHPSKPSI